MMKIQYVRRINPFVYIADTINRNHNETMEKLHNIEVLLKQTKEGIQQEMADLSALTAEVTANGDAVQSAITLIQGIEAQLAAAGTDPAALAQLASDLHSNTQALADAVAANTPAAPTP